MSADAFKVFVGVRFDVDPADEVQMEKIETGKDPRIMQAKQADLEWFTGGRDENDYHIFIGKSLGWLGWEHSGHIEITSEELYQIIQDVSERMHAAGFVEPARVHFQFFGDQ